MWVTYERDLLDHRDVVYVRVYYPFMHTHTHTHTQTHTHTHTSQVVQLEKDVRQHEFAIS